MIPRKWHLIFVLGVAVCTAFCTTFRIGHVGLLWRPPFAFCMGMTLICALTTHHRTLRLLLVNLVSAGAYFLTVLVIPGIFTVMMGGSAFVVLLGYYTLLEMRRVWLLVVTFFLVVETGILWDVQVFNGGGLTGVQFAAYSEVSPVIWVPIVLWQVVMMTGIGFQLYYGGVAYDGGWQREE